jgi:PKD repeat protein/Tol biopolymer transport system component
LIAVRGRLTAQFVAHRSALLLFLVSVILIVAPSDTGSGPDPEILTERVSVSSSGDEADGESSNPAISADGRYVAFESRARNLLPEGKTSARRDIYVHDRQTGQTTRVSVSSLGEEADGDSFNAAISGDGRYVAFESRARNLVPGGKTNTRRDIYVHDRQTGQTTRVSVSSLGEEADGESYNAAISADGRYVAFESEARSLLPVEKTSGKRDIYVHDRQTGETTRVSVSTLGEAADRESYNAAISMDGRYVAFESWATNLAPSGVVASKEQDIYVHDRQTGQTTRVSVSSLGEEADRASYNAAISGDGRYVAFESGARNLVPGGKTNTRRDIYVHDRQTGETTRVSVSSLGEEADRESFNAAISANGRYVAFESRARNLLAGGKTNDRRHIYVHDRETGETTRVSVSTEGHEGNGDSFNAVISGDGGSVAFHSDASNLVEHDTNKRRDVFVHDRSIVEDTTAPIIEFVSPTDGSTVSTSRPTITVTFSDTESGVDPSTYKTFINGVDVTPTTGVTPDGATYTPTAPLPAGDNTLTASVADRAGNVASVTIHFTVAVFRAIPDCAPTTGTSPLSVTFRTRGEFTGGSIVRYRWDFQGDGTFDTSDAVAQDFTRVFNQAGTFKPVLEVTNNLGQKATDTCTIVVSGNAPRASATATPSNGPVPLAVNFSCTATDPDGTIAKFEWDFDGDGVFDFSSTTTGSASHTYPGVGTFVATCRVTDNTGLSSLARTTTTVIRPAPPGSPTVTATATPATGNAPLTVNFNGSAVDDGTIVKWEWDFDGDGVFDFVSTTSPATSFVYTNAGVFGAALRATDNDGLTGIANVEVVVNLNATLSIPANTFEPSAGQTAAINTSLTAGVPVKLLIKNRDGAVIRTLVNTIRAAGNYSDLWDGRDDAGNLLPEAPYFAVLEYDFSGETRVVDLTNTTGGTRYNPARNNLPSLFRPFEDDHLTITFTVPANQGASEIQAFIGLFNTDTRFVTLLDRVPFGVGTHTIRWDGLDANGLFAVPPPGDAFLFGIFGFTLPRNAIFLKSAPVLTNVTVSPNFFDPSTPSFLTPANPLATVTFDLSKTADVELTVTNLKTGRVLRRIQSSSVPAGAGRTIVWDGRADDGLFADAGDYRLALRAVDSTASDSLTRYALMRVFY